MTARSIERPLGGMLVAIKAPSEEQKLRIFENDLLRKSIQAYFSFPEVTGPNPRFPYRVSLTVPRVDLEAAAPAKLREMFKKHLNVSDALQVQTRPIPEGGNVWIVKDPTLEKRTKFVLGKFLWIPATLQVKKENRWKFLEKLEPVDLLSFGKFIDFALGLVDTKRFVSVGLPGSL